MKHSKTSITLLLIMAAIHIVRMPANAQTTNLSGLWSGTTLVTPCDFAVGSRCNAQNNITLTLRQQDNQIAGSYTCATGTMVCRNGGADNTGNVQWGRISGNLIRLSLIIPADVSNCYYNGILTSPNAMHGTYMFFNGGALVEEGTWDVKRSSGQ